MKEKAAPFRAHASPRGSVSQRTQRKAAAKRQPPGEFFSDPFEELEAPFELLGGTSGEGDGSSSSSGGCKLGLKIEKKYVCCGDLIRGEASCFRDDGTALGIEVRVTNEAGESKFVAAGTGWIGFTYQPDSIECGTWLQFNASSPNCVCTASVPCAVIKVIWRTAFAVVQEDTKRTVKYTVLPNGVEVTATLTLLRGTGLATFGDGSSAVQISGSHQFDIVGVLVSSEVANIRLEACSHIDFTVARIDLDIIHPGTGEVPDDIEEHTGLVAIRLDDRSPVTSLLLRQILPVALGGIYTLTLDCSMANVWKDPQRTIPVLSDETTFSAEANTLVFMEGITESAAIADQRVQINWYGIEEIKKADTVGMTVVRAEFEIMLKFFIREQWINVPVRPINHPVHEYIAGSDDRNAMVGRLVSYRVAQMITVIPFEDLQPSGFMDGTKANLPGRSVLYIKKTSVPFPKQGYSTANRLLPGATAAVRGAPDVSRMKIIPLRDNVYAVTVELAGSANDPLVWFSFDIDWKLQFRIDATDWLQPKWAISGKHDNYPAIEIDLDDFVNPRFQPYSWGYPPGAGVGSLADGVEIIVPLQGGTIP